MIKLTCIENLKVTNYETSYIILNTQGKEISLFYDHSEIKIILINSYCTININTNDNEYLFAQKKDILIFENKNGFLILKNNIATCVIE